MPPLPVQIDEVDHVAVGDPVDEVPRRARRDEREREREERSVVVVPQIAHHQDDDDEGERHEKTVLPAACVGEKRERGSAVVREHEIEEGRHRKLNPGIEISLEPEFRHLVQDENRGPENAPEREAPALGGGPRGSLRSHA